MDLNSWLPGKPHKEKFEEVCAQYKDWIYLFCYKLLKDKQAAEDATAETLNAFWRHMADIEGEAHIKPFLIVTARNRCLNELRRRGRWKMDELPEEKNDEAAVTPADIMERKDEDLREREELEQAMELLPERMRAVFRLRYIEKKSFKEIAAILGISFKTAYGQWSNAKARLRKILGNGKK